MLELAHAGARRDGRQLLRGLTLGVPEPGALTLVGASGAGKSTLLAALAGAGNCVLEGRCMLGGETLPLQRTQCVYVDAQHRLGGPETLAQRYTAESSQPASAAAGWLASLGMAGEARALDAPADSAPVALRRALALRAALERNARLYLVDEPTAGLEPPLARGLRERLRTLAARALVVVATRDRDDCHALGGIAALLADGTLREHASVERFFAEPATPAGRAWVATGRRGIASHVPSGFWWLEPGRLAGLPRPGMLDDASAVYHFLAAHGVKTLICLDPECGQDDALAAQLGVAMHCFAVPDMCAPTIAQAHAICAVARDALVDGQAVAVNCRGGLGRTGTALAAILVATGMGAGEAIARVRAAQPYAIQTLTQFHFVHDFAESFRGA